MMMIARLQRGYTTMPTIAVVVVNVMIITALLDRCEGLRGASGTFHYDYKAHDPAAGD